MLKKSKSNGALSFLISFLMIFSLMLPFNISNVKAVETAEPIYKSTSQDGKKIVNVVFFNDLHGAVEEAVKGKDTGVAKLAGAINEIKGINKDTMVVSAGDNYQGSAMSNLKYGAPINDFIKAVGVKYSAVGNHEFDWGVDKIANWSKDGGFKFLASNIYDKKTGKPVQWAHPYEIVEMGGVKIGFIGLATPETLYKTKPTNVANLEFKNPKEFAEKWSKVAKEKGADVVIALTHMGSFQDGKTGNISGEVTELTAVKDVDAVISSHSHQRVLGKVNGKPVVQAYCNGRCLGILSMVIGKDGKVEKIVPNVDDLYKRKDKIKEDSKVKEITEKYRKEVAPLLDEVLGTTDKELAHSRFEGASILGEWVCDVMRKSAGTEIALTNGGGLRCSISEGNITMGELYKLMPFDNTLVKMELKGSDLKKVIENGIDNKKIGWIQLSGVKVFYDKDKEFGNRITSMRLENGTLVEANKKYSVTTNDFMAVGGDGYDFSKAFNVVDLSVPIRDALVTEVKKLKKISVNKVGYIVSGKDTTPIKPEVKPEVKPVVKPAKSIVKNKQRVHVVRKGEYIYKIAKIYKVKWQDIVNLNKFINPYLVFPGQQILIP